MSKNYSLDRQVKRKTGAQALWLLMVFLLIAISVVIRLIITGDGKNGGTISGLPTSDDAYSAAKDIVAATVKSSTIDFNDSGYQFGKNSDSVYVVKSTADVKDANGERSTLNFKIVMKYNGGLPASPGSWSVVDIDER